MRATVGKYVPGNSLFHRIDPRVKLFASMTIVILLFLVNYFLTSVIVLICVVSAFLITTRNPKSLLKLLRTPVYICTFLFIINCFISTPLGQHVIDNNRTAEAIKKLNDEELGSVYQNLQSLVQKSFWDVKSFNVSYVGIIRTINIVLKIFTLIITTIILTYSTKPIMLTQAIEFFLWPLKYPFKLIGFRIQILSMIISLALRFIPTLLDEANRIMKAQSSRGVDFKNGKFKEKIQSTVTLIVPLFVTAFAKAGDLANAMETRGYDPYAKRTKYRRLTLGWKDLMIVLFIACLIGIVVYDWINTPALGKALDTYSMPEFWLLTQSRF